MPLPAAPTTLPDLFSAFNQLTVLVVGDVMLDAYVWGKATRLSPEAPVPIVNVSRTEQRLGGAANVALNVQALGATPLLCAVIGEDQGGGQLLELLRTTGLSAEGIVRSAYRPTAAQKTATTDVFLNLVAQEAGEETRRWLRVELTQ